LLLLPLLLLFLGILPVPVIRYSNVVEQTSVPFLVRMLAGEIPQDW
jgi:hypothetical protein